MSSARILAGLVIALCAAIALVYAGRSAYLGVTLTRSMPFLDQWSFVQLDYRRYAQGRYQFRQLFKQRNEHRPMTTKAVLFADAVLFRMQGYLPVLVMYVALAAVAGMLAWLAVGPAPPISQLASFSILLGITWSISQFRDLSWAYEVGFPLLHVFALSCLLCFAMAVTTTSRARYAWLAGAVINDFLAIWSLGSGIFLTVSLVALAVWLRAGNRVAALFFGLHVLLLLHFLGDYQVANKHHTFVGLSRSIELVLNGLGWPFRMLPFAAVPAAGAVGLILFLIMAVANTTARKPDRNLSVILAFAGFALLEMVILSYTRAKLGGASARHANISVMFIAGVVAALWRWLSLTLPPLRWAALAAAIFAIVVTNMPAYARAWERHAMLMDEAAAAARSGDIPDDLWRKIASGKVREIATASDLLELLRRERLGPYAAP